MKMRVVPMTERLKEALTAHRHLRGDRVLYTNTGRRSLRKVLQKWIRRRSGKVGGIKATELCTSYGTPFVLTWR